MSVKFSGFALALPTLSLGFCVVSEASCVVHARSRQTWKSFCFSFLFLLLEPIVACGQQGKSRAGD